MNWLMFLTGILFLVDAFLGFGGGNSYVYYAPGVMFLAGSFVNEKPWKIFIFVTWGCLIIGIIMLISGIFGINFFS